MKRNVDETIAFVDSDEELSSKYREAYKRYSKLYDLLMAARVLEDEEIEELCQMCTEYADWFPETFNTTTTLKLHTLADNVPPFVRRWKSIGLFAEQSVESVHAAYNKLMRSFSSVKNQATLFMSLAERRAIDMDPHLKSLLAPIDRRKCKCGHFFVTKNGVKKCKATGFELSSPTN